MKAFSIAAAAALLSLAACGGKGDDALGDEAAEAADAKADQLEAMADNASGPREDALEAQAEITRDLGEAREEAIDDVDVDADAISEAQKNAMVNGE